MEFPLNSSPMIRWMSAFSKEVKPGVLFVAKGKGYQYIREAIDRGATALLTEKPYPDCPIVQYVVSDIDAAAKEWARKIYGEPYNQLTCIAVVGTNGKTTTATLLHHLLSPHCGLIGTIEYKIGSKTLPARLTTPDYFQMQTLLADMVTAGCKYCVMEVSSHALDQKRVDDIPFKMGIFTNFSQDHLDYHGTMENYFLAKKKLFDTLGQTSIAVLNRDDAKSQAIVADCQAKIIYYGPSQDSPLIGHHNAYNTGAALAAYLALGQSSPSFEGFHPPAGRLEKVGNFPIYVDFAHTEEALKAAIQAVKNQGRVILVFGCGGDRDYEKRAKMGAAASEADLLIVTSDNPRTEEAEKICREIVAGITNKNYTVCVDRKKAIEQAICRAGSRDIVLITGRGHEKYQKIAGKQVPFDDVEVAKEIAAIVKG